VSSESITVTAKYRVAPGREMEFSSWAITLFRLAAEQPGYLGAGVLATGQSEWHIIYRFDGEEAARTWEDSFTWTHWGAQGALFTQETEEEQTPTFQSWFEGPVRAMPPPPPKWKLWCVNTSAVFPPVLMFNVIIIPYLSGVNFLIRTLALCVAVSAIVTWILMPRLQRLFKEWLYPSIQSISGRHRRPMENGQPLQNQGRGQLYEDTYRRQLRLLYVQPVPAHRRGQR
jgi:antibiotic biosynthesis monooxygenase (ABM) superfamily enzyme